MLEKYRTANITTGRILDFFKIIGELKIVDFETLKTVKKPVLDKVATKKLINRFLTDKLLKLTENDGLQLTVKSLELLKNSKLNIKHVVKIPKDSYSLHSKALSAFLLPYMFDKNYHAILYRNLDDHHLRPDACLVFLYPEGYKIKFVEVERTDKDPQYLLEKYEKYISVGQDINTWDNWWRRYYKDIDLPFCEKEQFCFSVICQGKKTFDKEGWEWV